MTEAQIRDYRDEDFDFVVEAHNTTNYNHAKNSDAFSPPTTSLVLEWIQKAQRQSKSKFYAPFSQHFYKIIVMERHSKPVAYMCLWIRKRGPFSTPFKKQSRFVFINDIFVSPEYRQQGLASQLIGEATSLAQKENFSQVLATVHNWNTKSIALFKKLHFDSQFGEDDWKLYSLSKFD